MEAEEDADAILDRAEVVDLSRSPKIACASGLVAMKDVVHDNIERLERVITEGKRITGLVHRLRAAR